MIYKQVALTTLDNPFNPFTEFDKWLQFDNEKGYNSCSYLARIAKTSDQLSDYENNLALERAIDDIIAEHNNQIYTKVYNTDDSIE